jgi:hypothetical protein
MIAYGDAMKEKAKKDGLALFRFEANLNSLPRPHCGKLEAAIALTEKEWELFVSTIWIPYCERVKKSRRG